MTTPNRRVRVAVDAMGGDYGPSELVPGAAAAARMGDVDVLLVGDEEALRAELAKLDAVARERITFVPSQGVVHEGGSPVQSLRQMPRSSIAVAGGLVQAGKADALVSMGSTGATVAVATLMLGMLEGLERPAMGGPMFGLSPNTMVVDIGSNVDARPAQMLQFAALGCAFARALMNVQDPRVALLSVGAEEGKGNRQGKEAYTLFKESGLHFVGNVEGHDLLLPTPKAEVVVCDGFVGNVILKLAEATGHAMSAYLDKRLATQLLDDKREALARDVRGLFDASLIFGGAPLLGVKGVAIVGHGRGRASLVEQAIGTAKRCVQTGFVQQMQQELGKINARAKPPAN
ncbi:MAG: phosphate acyltransferase PlsX [Dehalococcoidia bacterium]|nr:phosphate acyltransferase PlsX [Dehalococcoidia bacterium]